MALIKCPDCGNPVSDKAVICPHCGIDVQKLLPEIREKQRLQQKKRRKRIIISVASVFVVGVVAVLAYLYSIDALNTIPSEYRKETESYFDRCKSAIDKGDFEKGTGILGALKTRSLTNRQKKRCEEMNKVLLERGLNDLESTLAAITNNYEYKSMERAKKEIAILNTYQLDASQTERLSLATNKYMELQLGEIEKTISSYKANMQNSSYFEKTNRLTHDLQGMELSTAQKTRLEDAVEEAERIKEQAEKDRHRQLLKTIRDEYVRLIGECTGSYETGYFLYDIDGNGIPELWIKTGECEADYQLFVYTYNNGSRQIYNGDAGHTTFYVDKDNNSVFKIYAHMGYARWEVLTYDGQKINSNEFYEEDISDTDYDYTTPTEGKLVNLYPLNNKRPIMDVLSVK